MVESTHEVERIYSIMVNGVHATHSDSLAMGSHSFDSGPGDFFVAAYLEEISKICIFSVKTRSGFG